MLYIYIFNNVPVYAKYIRSDKMSQQSFCVTTYPTVIVQKI